MYSIMSSVFLVFVTNGYRIWNVAIPWTGVKIYLLVYAIFLIIPSQIVQWALEVTKKVKTHPLC